MATRFQAASLVASPVCPNAVAWSDENLIAVASGHLVTIINPAMPSGPRGLITISSNDPFPVGVVERKDLFAGCLLPSCLSRDTRPCVRSISWSPAGLAPNAGCLLAVCTTEGRVKLYRFPFGEFSAEWIEVRDISDLLYTYYSTINFGESEPPSEIHIGQVIQVDEGNAREDDQPLAVLVKTRKRRRQNTLAVINYDSGPRGTQASSAKFEIANSCSTSHTQTATAEVKLLKYSKLQNGSSVEVLAVDGNQRTWVAGKLDKLDGGRAHVIFPPLEGNGGRDKWVEIDPQSAEHRVTGQTHAPKIRPSMRMSNFPEQLLLGKTNGVEEILKNGQAVETWKNQRWFEGVFMGFSESSLLVKLSGDAGLITVDASCVRLAPSWNNEKKSWHVTVVRVKKNRHNLHKAVEIEPEVLNSNSLLQVVSVPNSSAKAPKKVHEKSSLPLITAAQYASRSAMLSSLVVAWSPILCIQSDFGLSPSNDLPQCCSILAMASKTGRVSFWRINKQQCYSILPNRKPTAALLIGLRQAHKNWITAMSFFAFDASNPQLVLATGSSDGSVKIWQGCCGELMKASEDNLASFSLLKEVLDVDYVPVSALSLIIPASQSSIILAVGKGSGALIVCIYDKSTNKVDKVVQDDAHDHIVTGLAWAFDGSCLYSCSQDDALRSWIFHGNTLHDEPLPFNTLGVKSSNDVPNVFDSCFGLAVSPANLVVAVARSFDADLLNPMYQARSQKAAVEFFWIGGQKLEKLWNRDSQIDVEAFPDKRLVHWEDNILWSLNQYEHLDKSLVVWDIVAALLAFKQSVPNYVEHVLIACLTAYVGTEYGLSPATILPHASQFLPNITSRQLHLLSILSRRVVLSEEKEHKLTRENQIEGLKWTEDEQLSIWVEFVESIEKELRVRLIGSSFSAVVNLASQPSRDWCKPGCWQPLGVVLMEKWIATNDCHVENYLRVLASKFRKLKKRIETICKHGEEEQCSYCSASVPFEDAEVAFCKGEKRGNGVGQKHKLARCAASMQVCPTSPTWFCVCCQRRVSNFAPASFFTLPRFPATVDDSKTISSAGEALSKPLCPFCGILLQRQQPVFLLSASPV